MTKTKAIILSIGKLMCTHILILLCIENEDQRQTESRTVTVGENFL